MKWGATIDVGMTGIREEACPYCKHERERVESLLVVAMWTVIDAP